MRRCLLAKWPVPGRVKTRLVPALGLDGAASLARAMLEDVVDAFAEGARPLVALEGAPDGLRATPPFDRAEVVAQGGGDLGARMVRVLARGCASAPSAVVVGGDVVGLPPATLEDARAALETADAVIGPASDGGYYLLGARARALPALGRALAGVRFGTALAGADTLQGLSREGLLVAELAPFFDVDEPSDLERLAALLSAHPERAPRTLRWLGARAAIAPGGAGA